MATSEKNLEVLKKLKALADRGVGGEKENAQALLEKLLKKYHVDIAELDDDVLEDHEFKYSTPFEKRLLFQLVYKICDGRRTYRIAWGKGKNTVFGCTCTKAEALQITVEYDFYRELWNEECSFFFDAFIQKHQIFDTKPGHKTTERDDDYIFRMSMMINGMQDKSLNPMIEEGEKK